jgi:hypothetical protein
MLYFYLNLFLSLDFALEISIPVPTPELMFSTPTYEKSELFTIQLQSFLQQGFKVLMDRFNVRSKNKNF